jgi:hypothetical protein
VVPANENLKKDNNSITLTCAFALISQWRCRAILDWRPVRFIRSGAKKSDKPEHYIHFPNHYEQEHHDILNSISY